MSLRRKIERLASTDANLRPHLEAILKVATHRDTQYKTEIRTVIERIRNEKGEFSATGKVSFMLPSGAVIKGVSFAGGVTPDGKVTGNVDVLPNQLKEIGLDLFTQVSDFVRLAIAAEAKVFANAESMRRR